MIIHTLDQCVEHDDNEVNTTNYVLEGIVQALLPAMWYRDSTEVVSPILGMVGVYLQHGFAQEGLQNVRTVSSTTTQYKYGVGIYGDVLGTKILIQPCVPKV